MISQSMVFGPDEDGESIVVEVEDGSVENVILRDSNEQQIPFKELTKEHWLKMNEAEDQALERIQRAKVESETGESVALDGVRPGDPSSLCSQQPPTETEPVA